MNSPLSRGQRLLVVNGYPLAIFGQGIGVYTIRLLRGLLKVVSPESLRVVIPQPMAKHARWLPPEIVEQVPGSPPPHTNQLIHDIYWASRLGAYVKSRYPNCIFHCPREYYAWSSPAATVTTIHDCNHWIFPSSRGSFARAWWRRATERFAAKRSPLTLTVSNWARRDLVNVAKIPEDKIRVIYNWADSSITRTDALAALPQVRARYRIPEKYFLYVGGFSANKNIDALLRAYARACTAQAMPVLVAAGDLGQYRHAFGRDFGESLRAFGIPADKVITPGFVAAEELPPLIAGAALLAYPSKSEGFGYPPVEALALGTPVLVANATSMLEVVRNDRCRFAPHDETELESKLRQAALDPSLFACELAEEFTEAYGIRHYLDVMGSIGLAEQTESRVVGQPVRA